MREPATPNARARPGDPSQPPAPVTPPRRVESAGTARSFVIQVRPGWSGDAATLAGRIQHLPTGDGGNFASGDDLLAILRRVLDRDGELDPPVTQGTPPHAAR